MHIMALIVACGPVFVCFAPVPFGKGLILADMDTGEVRLLDLGHSDGRMGFRK